MTINPKKTYKRIFLLGPSHSVWLDGASVNTEADYYATPLGNVKVDRETALKLTEDSVFTYHPDAHDNEHCLEVQLPFLQRLFNESVPPIVPIIISTNDFQQLIHIANVLKPYLNDDNLFIISSDFSHYPSYDDAYEVDARTQRAIESGSVSHLVAAVEKNRRSGKRNLSTSACGQVPIITLLIMCNEAYDIRHLLYQNSGDISGERDRVVGYHSFAFLHPVSSATLQSDSTFTLTSEDKRILKDIALTSIRDSLDGKPLAAANSCVPSVASGKAESSLFTLHSSLKRPCGAFVSLPSSRPCDASRASTSSSSTVTASTSVRATAAAPTCPRWPTRSTGPRRSSSPTAPRTKPASAGTAGATPNSTFTKRLYFNGMSIL